MGINVSKAKKLPPVGAKCAAQGKKAPTKKV